MRGKPVFAVSFTLKGTRYIEADTADEAYDLFYEQQHPFDSGDLEDATITDIEET